MNLFLFILSRMDTEVVSSPNFNWSHYIAFLLCKNGYMLWARLVPNFFFFLTFGYCSTFV
jgi:hypothetical protein